MTNHKWWQDCINTSAIANKSSNREIYENFCFPEVGCWGKTNNSLVMAQHDPMLHVYSESQEVLTSDPEGHPKPSVLSSLACFSLTEQRLKVAEMECVGSQMFAMTFKIH